MCFGIVTFADTPLWVGASGIEISQGDVTNSVYPFEFEQQLFALQFGHTIRIDRGLRMGLVNRQIPRFAICGACGRSEEHTSELQSLRHLVCRLLLEKKNKKIQITTPA